MAVQKIVDGDTTTRILSATGAKFSVKDVNPITSVARKAFDDSLEAVDVLTTLTKNVGLDPDLSPAGRAKRLAPVEDNTLRTVSAYSAGLDLEMKNLDARVAELLAPRPIDAGNFYLVMRERELRDVWRSLDPQERMEYLSKMQASAEYEEAELALLRSPVRLLDHELVVLRAKWDSWKRQEHVAEFVAIDSERASLEWARTGLAHLGGITMTFLRWEPMRVMRTLATGTNEHQRSGYAVFGLSKTDAARADLELSHEKLRQAA